MPDRYDRAPDLPRCPKCGGVAVRAEVDTVFDRRYHVGYVCCEEDRCFHIGGFNFPDHSDFIGGARHSTLPDVSYEDQWKIIDAEWIARTGDYKKKKAYLADLEGRRCSCGCTIKRGWNYCPICGEKKEVR